MKQLTFAALAVLVLLGCQKENIRQTTSSADPNQKLADKIAHITDKFMAEQEKTTKPGEGGQQPPIAEAAHADVDQMVLDYSIGYFPGHGILAMICNAVVASWNAYSNAGIPVFEPGTPTGNPYNAYDYAGQVHYEMMAEILAEPSIVMTNNEIDYAAYRQYALATFEAHGYPTGSLSAAVTPQSIQQEVESYNPGLSAAEFVNSLQLSAAEKQILIPYLTAFRGLANGQQFISYSIQVEHSITASNLPENSKVMLLSVMSTARCATEFYRL